MKVYFINLLSPLALFAGFSLEEFNITLDKLAYLVSTVAGLYAIYVNYKKKKE